MSRMVFPWEAADEVTALRKAPFHDESEVVSAISTDDTHKSKSQEEGISHFVHKIRQVLPRLRRSKLAAETTSVETAMSGEQPWQSYIEADVTMGTTVPTSTIDHIQSMTQDETTMQIMLRKPAEEPEEKKLNVDTRHFRKLTIPPTPSYWFIIFKGIIASLCVALNTFHLLHAVALFPPTFSIFKLQATNYEDAMTTAVGNIYKLTKDRVGLVVRWEPYSEISNSKIYTICKVLINNYQWSEWVKFESTINQSCGIKTYIRYNNLRIMKMIQKTTRKAPKMHCPATVQYKRTWDRACCPQGIDLHPLENYFDLPYDSAFCIVKSSLRFVNASELSKGCKVGKLWAPLPIAVLPSNTSNYQQSNIVKSYEIQRDATLNNYWIDVVRVDGTEWLRSGRPANFDPSRNCEKDCYIMERLLSSQADMRYSSKERHYVCVKDGKWELFSTSDSNECLAICIVEADSTPSHITVNQDVSEEN